MMKWRRLGAIALPVMLCCGVLACAETDVLPGEGQAALMTDADVPSSDRSEPEGEGEHRRREGEGEHAEEGEHGGEGGHDEGGEEGEESGVYIGVGETWDVIRRGARLVLAFDSESNAFRGTVENTTERTLCAVRVEVHLSTRLELGPTPRGDLPPGETMEVELAAEDGAFERWTAHPEVSACAGD